MAEAEVVQMYQKPLGLSFGIFRLVGFKVLHVDFGCINNLAVRLLKEVKREFQKWNQDFVFLDVCRVELLDGERLLTLSAGNFLNI